MSDSLDRLAAMLEGAGTGTPGRMYGDAQRQAVTEWVEREREALMAAESISRHEATERLLERARVHTRPPIH